MKTFSFAMLGIIKKVERIKERFFLQRMSGYNDADEILFAWLKAKSLVFIMQEAAKKILKPDFMPLVKGC